MEILKLLAGCVLFAFGFVAWILCVTAKTADKIIDEFWDDRGSRKAH